MNGWIYTQKMDSNADGRVEMDEFIRCCLEVKRILIHLEALESSSKQNILLFCRIKKFQISLQLQ